jgi:Protein of unknown function (DUF2380).
MMYALWELAVPLVALVPLAMTQAASVEPVAVFDFELIDTSLDGEMNGPRADEQQRIVQISNALRRRLAETTKFRVVDIAPVDAQAHAVHLQECGGCDADLAAKVGAKLSIAGTVQKVSNLILNMNIYVRNVATGELIAAMSADMRGNTDKSWSRALDFLVRNRLLPALDGVHE